MRRFQEEQGNLTVDGMVGPATWRALSALILPPIEDIEPIPEEPKPPPSTTAAQRLRMAKSIVDFEARRDSHGRLAVYNLPPADGGGNYEVAGINDRYHKEKVDELVALINAGKHDEAEQQVIEYVAAYTDVAEKWHPSPAVQSYLRDCVFNRGPTGAMRILQRAAKVPDDGDWGPKTKAAVEALTQTQLLPRLRTARESYERDVAKRDEFRNFGRA